MQIRIRMFAADRPDCPGGCSCLVHRHGFYVRFAKPSGNDTFRVQRFYCPGCGLTISVLPDNRLPYRPLQGERLEAFFNQEAEAGTGPDPPPDELEAGCLRRAWTRFQTRAAILKEAFGLLIANATDSAAALWKQMRRAKGTLEDILLFLAQPDKRSLLGDYLCQRLPG